MWSLKKRWREFTWGRFLLCWDQSFAISKVLTNMRELKTARIVAMTRVVISSSTAVKKSSSLKREWVATKSMSSTKNRLPGTHGSLRSGHKLKSQTNLLSSSLSKSRQSKKAKIQWDLFLVKRMTRLSVQLLIWSKSLFLWLFCSELSTVSVTKIFSTEFASIVLTTLRWKRPLDQVLNLQRWLKLKKMLWTTLQREVLLRLTPKTKELSMQSFYLRLNFCLTFLLFQTECTKSLSSLVTWQTSSSRRVLVRFKRMIEITTVKRGLTCLVLYLQATSDRSLETSLMLCRRSWKKTLTMVMTRFYFRRQSSMTLSRTGLKLHSLLETGVKIRMVMFKRPEYLKYWIDSHLLLLFHTLEGWILQLQRQVNSRSLVSFTTLTGVWCVQQKLLKVQLVA